jgi:hypothetical protein
VLLKSHNLLVLEGDLEQISSLLEVLDGGGGGDSGDSGERDGVPAVSSSEIGSPSSKPFNFAVKGLRSRSPAAPSSL